MRRRLKLSLVSPLPTRIICEDMALQAGTRLGSYELISLIGAGGMGEVYRARDTRPDRSVAVKVLASELAGPASATLTASVK